jgi:hypothetical protein
MLGEAMGKAARQRGYDEGFQAQQHAKPAAEPLSEWIEAQYPPAGKA